MSLGWTIAIIVIVMGIIAGNILLLRYSAKMNPPKNSGGEMPKGNNAKWDDEDD